MCICLLVALFVHGKNKFFLGLWVHLISPNYRQELNLGPFTSLHIHAHPVEYCHSLPYAS